MEQKYIYNYDDQFNKPVHEAKEKVPMMTHTGINMVQDGRVVF